MVEKVLITGVAGFIGFSIAYKLLKEEITVIGIDALKQIPYDVKIKKLRLKLLLSNSNFHFYRIDISREEDKLGKIIKTWHPDVIIHEAALAGVRNSIMNPDLYINNNTMSTLILFQELVNKNLYIPVILASSSSVYGRNVIPFTESQVANPLSPYALSKVLCEDIAKYFSKNYSIPVIVLRYFTVYGPLGRPDMAYFKIGLRILKEEPVIVYKDYNPTRDMTYIDDVVIATCKAMEVLKDKGFDFEIFNVCYGKSIDINSVINIISKYLGKRPIIKRVPAPKYLFKIEPHITLGDNSKLFKKLNIKIRTPPEVGLKHFCWWLKHEAHSISDYNHKG